MSKMFGVKVTSDALRKCLNFFVLNIINNLRYLHEIAKKRT